MEKKSTHILNASTNLLGFSMIIITSLKITKTSHHTFLDEFAGIACVFFACSSLFSFMSIRSKKESLRDKYEGIADYLFLIALFCIILSVIIITTSIMD